MARKTPKTRRHPATARPAGSRPGPSAPAGAAGEAPSDLRSADLDTSYTYVKQDLQRIAVIFVALVAVIVAAPFVLR